MLPFKLHPLALCAVLLVGLSPLLAGCDSGTDASSAGTVYGGAHAVGGGTARTFVRLDASGDPEAIGVVLTEAALTDLPTGHGGGHRSASLLHDGPLSTTLRFPAEAAGVPVDHLSLDWNPDGHEPDGLFTVPHFDFHFYMVPEATRMAWTPGSPGFDAGLNTPLDSLYRPAGYLQLPGGVPQMGAHLIDTTDPTFAPGGPAFTEVLLYGAYDGALVFVEPMITKAFLETRPTHTEPIAQPPAYAVSGYYPTQYAVRYDAARGEYVVALEGLVYRQAR